MMASSVPAVFSLLVFNGRGFRRMLTLILVEASVAEELRHYFDFPENVVVFVEFISSSFCVRV